jgi:glyceraldehyde 3-phosphate dehydrogenase
MGLRVAINGFGRIGRAFFRAAWDDPAVSVVAVNDLGPKENLLYLLRYDSVYGKFDKDIAHLTFLQEKDPSKLPWQSLGVDVVVESTGIFDSYEKSRAHITAGAKKVVITAPVKDAASDAATVLVGVNEAKLQTCTITSNASCTTNSASPLIAILDEAIGIERALLNTVHAYSSTRRLKVRTCAAAEPRRRT